MSQELLPGTRLSGGSYGGYTIERVLGRGGFGVTYMARSQIGIQFAVKEFFPKNTCERDTSSNAIIVTDVSKIDLISRLRQRFLDEARNLASCEHNYIVHVVESFEENGTAYMVMENVEGVTLQTCVRNNGPMDEGTASEIIIKAAQALHYLHNRRMTHLDIKPDNIILTASGDPVIIDFGLSRLHSGNQAASAQQFTAVSKGYTASEQYSRQLSFLPQSDVYSLAATYYFLLTGKRPPEPDANHVFEADLPSVASDAARFTISRGMRYNPQRRTQSMTTFIANVRGYAIDDSDNTPRRVTVGKRRNDVRARKSGVTHRQKQSHSVFGWNFLLFVILMACVAHILIYWEYSSGSLRSDYLFHMTKSEFFTGLGFVSLFSFVGLLSRSRAVKIFFAVLTLFLGAVFMLNFNLS